MQTSRYKPCDVKTMPPLCDETCSSCARLNSSVRKRGKSKLCTHYIQERNVFANESDDVKARKSQRAKRALRKPLFGSCTIRCLPVEIWMLVLQHLSFLDFLGLLVAVCRDACEACLSDLGRICKACDLYQLDASEHLLLVLAASTFPVIAEYLFPNYRRRLAVRDFAAIESVSSTSHLRSDWSSTAMDLVVENAQRLGVPSVLVEHAFTELAWTLNFVQFGQMVSSIRDIEIRAQIYRRLIARYSIGPRSAAANVLAALEAEAPERNQRFLARVVQDWDARRKAEFYLVIHAAFSDTERLHRIFFADRHGSRSYAL